MKKSVKYENRRFWGRWPDITRAAFRLFLKLSCCIQDFNICVVFQKSI